MLLYVIESYQLVQNLALVNLYLWLFQCGSQLSSSRIYCTYLVSNSSAKEVYLNINACTCCSRFIHTCSGLKGVLRSSDQTLSSATAMGDTG